MALITVFVVLILPIVLVALELYRRRKYSNLPPGPKPLPFLGNILDFVGEKMPKHELTAKLSEKYGDIFTLWSFSKPSVIITSYDAARQAFLDRQHDFASRPDTLVAVGLFDGYHNDLTFGDYTLKWQGKRKLFERSVRTLVGTELLETELMEVINQVIARMSQEGPNTAIDFQYYMHALLYNAALILTFGKRFDFDDPEFLHFVHIHDDMNAGISVCRFYDQFPILHFLPLFKMSPSLRKMKLAMHHFRDYLMRWYIEAKEKAHEDDINNMAVAMAKGVHTVEAKANANGDNQVYTDTEIMYMLMNLFTASTIPTSSATLWLFLEMIICPEIQQKCYEEIQQVTGGRPVTLNDRRSMPYVEACIMETLRHHSPISLNIPHAPSGDNALRDYTIPTGTETILNIWALHHNPKMWKDPNNFNPHNFLDDDGLLVRPPYFLPFGAGRRICPGDSFSKNLLFLTFAVMLQQFRLVPVDGHKYSAEPNDISSELINIPNWYPVRVEERN